ncbi:putative metallocarboxypeptidase ecm14 [Xylographa soralifera]|nr:putative metallocarboxypeptidase ecm14 [Xylographa soralifera]
MLARYGGDVVLRFRIHQKDEAKALAEAVNVLFLDVWEFNTEWVDIRLAKDVIPSLLGLLPASLQKSHTPLMHDLAQTIFESYPSLFSDVPEQPSHHTHRGFTPSLQKTPDETNIFFQQYQPLSVILPWLRLMESLFPTHVRLINIGITYEGRDIPALRVGVHPTNMEKPMDPRKTIIVAGGSHAREWISTSSVNYVAFSLITEYGKSKQMTKLVEDFDWIFIPSLNPDGYVFTWENDRLWRKNRQQTNLRFCKGLDLDRTYGFEWDGHATKSNPCSESFSGEGPFQGVESSRFASWVKNETEQNNANFVGFLDLHSYSQQILYPYSCSCNLAPPSLENLEELALGMAKAIRHVNSEKYGITSACEGSVMSNKKGRKDLDIWPRIENGGGSALDWFYHEMNVTYAYQLKLRDTGSYGFLLPSKNIIPTGKEVFAAVTYFGNYLLGDKGIEVSGMEGKSIDQVAQGAISSQVSRPVSLVDVESLPASVLSEILDEEDASEELNWELRRKR